MNTLPLVGLVSLDTRFWTSRATALYCQSQRLPLWIRHRACMLALETHANIRSLRAVDAQCPFSPSVLRWTSTVALLLCVSPRLALEMVKLFHACAMLDIEPYRRAFDAMMFVVGVALGLAVALTLGGET